ncbi:hypothetical protein HQ587_02860 [bacterium]|nr:hypothetical protein [bacterium]
MGDSVESTASSVPMVNDPRRILLEKQLSFAIQRAQKRYQVMNEQPTAKTVKSKSHLGNKIDIRA